jgi:hypothetical protein
MPPSANDQAEQARQMLRASGVLLGRTQGPELFDSTTFAASGIYNSRPINIDRPISEGWFELRYRITVAGAPYAAVSPEAPQNFLQQIIINGQHRDFGGVVPINISGATAYAWPYLFTPGAGGGEIIINGVRAANPGRPFVSPFTGAVGTYDIIQTFRLPFGPCLGNATTAKRAAMNFLLQGLDWGNSLRLQLRFGDASAFGDPTGATVTFSGFGGAGNPTLNVHFVYAILGELRNRMRSGLVFRNENTLTTFTAAANNQRLQDLSHQITTNVVIKSGLVQATGLTAGVDTFASLSDVQLDRTQIIADNKAIRDNQSNFCSKAYYEGMFGGVIPTGYFVQSFIDSQNPLTAFRGDGLSGGAQFMLQSDVLTASANNRQKFVQEYIQGGPFPAR